MKRFAAVLALGSLLAAAGTGVEAREGKGGGALVGSVTVQCSEGSVSAVQASNGVSLPATVVTGQACAQAVADLLNARFKLTATYDVSGVGPFFLFSGKASGGGGDDD